MRGLHRPQEDGSGSAPIIETVRRALAVLFAAAAVAAVVTASAPARGHECEAAGKVCLGTLPSSHARIVLKSRNGSGERGVARMILGFHETQVAFRLSGAPEGVRQTVNLLRGGCGGKVLVRLGSILNGKGVARGGQRGDLYVELKVVVPEQEDQAFSEALKRSSSLYTRPVREGIAL